MTSFNIPLHLGVKTIRFTVQETYISAQVLRFRITWSAYEMKVEKRLLLKRNQWRMTGANFSFTKPDSAENFNKICQAIELYLNPPTPRTFGVKDAETEMYFNRAQAKIKEEEDNMRKEKIMRLRKAKGFHDR